MTLEMLETILSGVAIGGFLSTVLVMVANGKATRVMWVGVAFFLCTISHVLDNLLEGGAGGVPGRTVFWYTQNLATGLLWAFILGVFDDAKGRFWPRFLPIIALAILNWLNRSDSNPLLNYYWVLYHLVSITMVGHLLFVLMRGIDGDLVEARRQLRVPMIFAAACYIGFVAWLDLIGRECCLDIANWRLIQAGLLAFMALGTTIGFLQAGAIFWGTRAVAAVETNDTSNEPLEGVEKTLLQRLQNTLEDGQIWKREGLSIGTLAHELAIPEYRLRRLINERLGYKNFADFINSHRIEAAKAALSDRAQVTLSISQLAFDLGFGSLGPFNRAFKASTDMSPTEWRAQNLADS
jgi:AraC-like DNA-binding protein